MSRGDRTPLLNSGDSSPVAASSSSLTPVPPTSLSVLLETIVDKSEWEDDKLRSVCPSCHAPFSIGLTGTSRSHCRSCGGSCCTRIGCVTRLPYLPSQSKEKGSNDGAMVSLKVCQSCYSRVIQLRHYLSSHGSALVQNTPRNRSATRFKVHFLGSKRVSYETELWLSGNLLLLMYRDDEGDLSGIPVQKVKEVKFGLYTEELRKQSMQTSCFCCSEETELGKIKDKLFTIIYANGQVITMEAPDIEVRMQWAERLNGMSAALGYFAEWRINRISVPISSLVSEEKLRIDKTAEERAQIMQKAMARQEKKEFYSKMREKYQKKE